MKDDEREPIVPVPKVAFSTARRRDIPKRVPPCATYRFIPSGPGYRWERVPVPDGEE